MSVCIVCWKASFYVLCDRCLENWEARMQRTDDTQKAAMELEIPTELVKEARAVLDPRNFSPEGFERVKQIKAIASLYLALLMKLEVPPSNREAGRLLALAKTELETSVMYAIKAISRGAE